MSESQLTRISEKTIFALYFAVFYLKSVLFKGHLELKGWLVPLYKTIGTCWDKLDIMWQKRTL